MNNETLRFFYFIYIDPFPNSGSNEKKTQHFIHTVYTLNVYTR